MRKKIIVIAIMALITGCAHQKVSIDTAQVKKVKQPVLTIQDASRIARANVIELNKMPISGDWYEAIMQFPNGNKGIVYIEANKKHMIAGAIFDARTGVNLTAQKMTKMGIKPPLPPKAKAVPHAISKLDKKKVQTELASIKAGAKVFHYGVAHGGEPLTVFVDPQCPYCHRAWPTIMNMSRTKPIDVVVVGFLGPKSEQMAAFINKKDSKSLDLAMRGKTPALDTKPKDIEKIKNTSASVVAMGVQGVPAFTRGGRIVAGFSGKQSIQALYN